MFLGKLFLYFEDAFFTHIVEQQTLFTAWLQSPANAHVIVYKRGCAHCYPWLHLNEYLYEAPEAVTYEIQSSSDCAVHAVQKVS